MDRGGQGGLCWSRDRALRSLAGNSTQKTVSNGHSIVCDCHLFSTFGAIRVERKIRSRGRFSSGRLHVRSSLGSRRARVDTYALAGLHPTASDKLAVSIEPTNRDSIASPAAHAIQRVVGCYCQCHGIGIDGG